ncbi:uncharacterized protein BDZ99DRAFT_293564 [Mytilinidion resinicola]|uniref:Uncharacterized protein n=1 Tax=Mytilinidion resinicola TaxID=574789 RepID=A0A6A6YRM5_9PEZI|nr:uncharacterized protein BDZ99DRAFT_293564 [Mytilinidion resinicola]KAF2811023.1 hypothetical protein BDZ99DRAFT_293564 [Mytilinidion resinicola]
MAEATRLIPQSTVDLPTSHFDFDFSSFDHGTKQGNLHTPYRSVFQGYGSCGTECTAKDCTCDAHSLLERRTEDTTREDAHPIARHYILKWPWQYFHHEHSNTPISSHSCKSISNTTKSNVSSVPDLTTCTTSSTPRSLNPWPENRPSSSLLSLSSAILNQILSYALTVPLIIPIGHELHDIMQIPGRNAHTTLRQSLDCPLFLVSHSIRNRALDVFFSKNIFIVDLAAIYDSSASYTDLQIKRLHKFWITETPAMVQLSLRRVSRLILRLPVPSTEAAVRRGREEQNWMDGSDGHGGGGYRMKSLKEEVEDSLIIQKCLRSIVRMVLAPERESTAPSTSSSRLGRLRRSKSTRGTKSNEGGERRALKLLEIILVKRSSRAMVLREVLGLVHLLKDIQVGGILRICFELNGRKTVWATKRKETWEDRISNTEPDGAKLLHGMQLLFLR